MKKQIASLSLDLDNLWAYLKIHGDPKWEQFPGYFNRAVPIILDLLKAHDLKITFFVVGKDAAIEENGKWLQRISAEGHEFGNHSFHHEPWMESRSLEAIKEELLLTHKAIHSRTGKEPVGFRGPGFCRSPALLEAVHQMDYTYDASLLPTFIGPLARMYYLMTTKTMKEEEKSTRGNLFGAFRNGLLPIKPFEWKLNKGKLLEIPVTTIPLIRFPFHISYIIWLARFSESLALFYFKQALRMCTLFKIEPSVLLHPVDFLGKEDAPELHFFPGMDLSGDYKRRVVNRALSLLKERFEVVPMSDHADRLSKERNVSKEIKA